MSDHGFAPFARAAHLNGWLRDQGLLALRPGATASRELFADVDWPRTRAYGFGLNGLYLNLLGRERFGAVSPAERERVIADLTSRLLDWADPANGAHVVRRVYRREEVYSGALRDLAPDLVIGYERGYRVSNPSALGEVPPGILEDNSNRWSGDHCIAADAVPGVVLSNRPITRGDVSPARHRSDGARGVLDPRARRDDRPSFSRTLEGVPNVRIRQAQDPHRQGALRARR